MLVSIVTPSLNQGAYIKATIDSVLSQDYPTIEYLVIDGGSTDQTVDILRSYGPRLQWISEPDAGQADAINRGFDRAHGEVIGWLNADDTYLPGAVSSAVRFLQENPTLAMVYGQADYVDALGAYVGPCAQVQEYNATALLNDLDFIVQPATFFLKSIFHEVGGLDSSLHYCFDYDLWLKIARSHEIGYLEQRIAQVRLHPATKTSTGGLDRLVEIERMIRRHGRRRIPTGFYGQMALARRDAALRSLTHGRLDRAIVNFGRGSFYALAHILRRRAGSLGIGAER